MVRFSVWAIALLLATASSAFAATYSIDIETQIDDQTPVRGSLTLFDGQEGKILFDNLKLAFMPTAAGEDQVRIEGEVRKKTRHGFRTIARPAVVTRFGETAEISQIGAKGERVRIKLTPTRAVPLVPEG